MRPLQHGRHVTCSVVKNYWTYWTAVHPRQTSETIRQLVRQSEQNLRYLIATICVYQKLGFVFTAGRGNINLADAQLTIKRFGGKPVSMRLLGLVDYDMQRFQYPITNLDYVLYGFPQTSLQVGNPGSSGGLLSCYQWMFIYNIREHLLQANIQFTSYLSVPAIGRTGLPVCRW